MGRDAADVVRDRQDVQVADEQRDVGHCPNRAQRQRNNGHEGVPPSAESGHEQQGYDGHSAALLARKLTRARHGLPRDQKGGEHLGVPVFPVKVEHKLKEGPLQPSALARQKGEPGPRQLGRPLKQRIGGNLHTRTDDAAEWILRQRQERQT